MEPRIFIRCRNPHIASRRREFSCVVKRSPNSLEPQAIARGRSRDANFTQEKKAMLLYEKRGSYRILTLSPAGSSQRLGATSGTERLPELEDDPTSAAHPDGRR